MNCNRFGLALSVIASAAVTLSACGGEKDAVRPAASPNPEGTSPTQVACGGKTALKASGSTAQEGAMSRFTKAFETSLPGTVTNLCG